MNARTRIAVLAMLAPGWWAPACMAQGNEKPVSDLEAVLDLYGPGKKIGDLKTELSGIQYAEKLNGPQKKCYEAAAQYYVCRVTWPEYAKDQKKLEAALEEFKTDYANFIERSKNRSYFHDQLAENFRNVFARDFLENRLTSVNAAQMLPGLNAKEKNEKFSTLLTDLIKDPKQHDAIKLYAIRALRDYFPLKGAGKEELVRVETLTEYIERKDWPVSKDDKDKLEQAAIFFVRREAIQTLAHAQMPYVKLPKKVGNQGQVAVTLLKVLAKEGLTPPPPAPLDPLHTLGLAEKCQAAFGLCDLKQDPGVYQPDIAVYAVGHCLSEFVDAYNQDKNFVRGGGAVGIKANGQRMIPLLPWKGLAERWKESLKNLADNNTAAGSPASAQAKMIQKDAEKMLAKIMKYDAVDIDVARDFKTSLKAPAEKKLFKASATPEVNLGY